MHYMEQIIHFIPVYKSIQMSHMSTNPYKGEQVSNLDKT
jgi:hypothetical protein